VKKLSKKTYALIEIEQQASTLQIKTDKG